MAEQISNVDDTLGSKYRIRHADGSPSDPNAEYFVLRCDEHCADPRMRAAAIKAVLVFADAVKPFQLALADSIIAKYGDKAE